MVFRDINMTYDLKTVLKVLKVSLMGSQTSGHQFSLTVMTGTRPASSGAGPKNFHSDRMNTLRDRHTSDGPVNCTPSVHKPSHVTPSEHLVEMVQ